MMDSYNRFSEVYDLFMNEIPYEKWADNIQKFLTEEGICDGLLLELGCGTGTMCELMAKKGYDMTGIDSSEEMLDKAFKKRDASGLPILYLLQDIREFELYGTMRAVFSVCDTMNYLTEDEDFTETIRLANNYLDPGGVFIFDLKTEYYYRDVLGSNTYASAEDQAAYIWENDYDEESRENEYLLTMFMEREDGSYDRSEEYHLQRAYSVEEVKAMAEEGGMIFEKVLDAGTLKEADERSERIYVILREKGKTPPEE